MRDTIGMPFRARLQPSHDPEAIVPLDSVPAYARLAEIRRALMAAVADRQRRLDIAAIEAEIGKSIHSTKGARAQNLRTRLTNLRAALPPPHSATPDAAGLSAVIVAGMSLAAGETIEPAPDRAATLNRLRTEMTALDMALRETDGLMETIREEESLVVAQKLQARNHLILRTIYDAALALSAAVEAERVLFASVLIGGYVGRPDIMLRPALSAASRLGTLELFDSELSFFARRLRDAGVL